MNTWSGYSRTAIAVAVTIVANAPALAQNTTAAIGGRVVGADGQPVAGASVTILHVQSGSTSTVTTDAAGRYGARGLRAGGPYTITITKGSLSEKREDIVLTLAETSSLDAVLGASAATVVITGRSASDKFNRSAMGAGTNIGSRELSTYASIQRSLQDYARTDPRLAQTDKTTGAISAAGQNNRYNSVTIDGVTTSDTFGLEGNNLPTKKQPISIDAIQSVQVNLSNYDVTQTGYTGANINAVTKSGTNEFKGSVYYVFRDDSLVGKSYNRQNESYSKFGSFEESTKGVTFGGPLVKDKLFFFVSYEDFKSTKVAPVFGPAGSSVTNVGIAPSAISGATSIAASTWNMDIGGSDASGLNLTVKDTLLKLDWNISDNHRASVRYGKTEQSEPLPTGTTFFSPTLLTLSSWWYTTDKTYDSVVGQWFADWTPSLSTELKVSERNYKQRHRQVNGTRLPVVSLAFSGTLPEGSIAGTNTGTRNLQFGTEANRHLNILDTKTTDLYFGANWTQGAHELKFGVDHSNNEVFNAFVPSVLGNYSFRCEDGVAYATPLVNAAGAATNCAGATAATHQAAALENFRLGRPSTYSVTIPRAGRTLDDAAARWEYGNTGLFLQDTWQISRNLNLMFGLRVDQQNVPTKPLFNSAAAAPRVAGSVNGNTVTRDTGGFGVDNTVTLDGAQLVQPRLGFNWNPGLAYRTQVRGGFGLFQGASPSVWLSNPFSNTGLASQTLSCGSFSACATANAVFNPDPANQPQLNSLPPAPGVDTISPGLRQPAVWKANLAFELETSPLPVVGALVLGAEWLHTKNDMGVFYQQLNLGAPTRIGPDGRELYYHPVGYNPACYSVAANGGVANVTNGVCALPGTQSRTRALSNANFGNVTVARETTKGYGDSLTLSVTRAAVDGFGWGLAFTRTVAKEVSPLTSSIANSNWNNRVLFNPNEEQLQNSNYMIRDRFSGNFSWSKAFIGSYRTTVGVFYEGRRGKPYSWTYLNDMNGDGQAANDLMFIPTGPGSGQVEFRGGAAEETRFWAIVDANPALRAAKGGVVGRNNQYAPWVNNFDMRVSQELPGFAASHKATFTLDFLNFGNLLNKRWGRIDEIAFPSRRGFVNYTGINAQGRYIYSLGSLTDLTTRQEERESQWAVQATLKYEF